MAKWSNNFEDILGQIKKDLEENMTNRDSNFVHKGKKVIVEYRTIEGKKKKEKQQKTTTEKTKKTKQKKSLSKLKNKKQIIVKIGSPSKLNYTVFPNNSITSTPNSVEKIDYKETAKHIEKFNKEFEQYNNSNDFREIILHKSNNAEIVFDKLESNIFKNSNADNDEIYLCIGLDVGSSTTKVVIKESFSVIGSDDVFYLVDFASRGICDQEYLLPTHISFDGNNYFIPKYGNAPTFTNLKVNYMNGDSKYKELLELYIAFVIKYTIAWFIEKHGNDDIIKNKNIIWSVNLGVPSAQFNSTGKNKKYLELLENAHKLIEKDIEFESLNIVPEIIASIQSFIKRNDIAHEGLYCVSDVGAGTLDVCTFRVSENEGNIVYSFYKSAVKKLGVYALRKCCNDLDSLSAVYNYRNEVLTSYRKVIYRTYISRDPYAKEWKKELPIASSGGGSSLSFYKSIINEDLTKWIKRYCIDVETNRDCQGFRELDIKYNLGNIITNIDNVDCSRLNVALGLSYNISSYDDIKRYYKECEIEDITQYKNTNIEDNFISKDMV